MTTRGERFAEMLRDWKERGADHSERALARRAGLTEIHVSQIRRRLASDPEASFDIGTIEAVAKAAGFSAAWVVFGTGSPKGDDDSRGPSTREGTAPERGNVIGFDDALAIVLAKHKFTDEVVASGERVAALTTRGIITPEEVLQILRLVEQQSDPARLERQLAEAYARQRQVLADAEAREAAAEAREKAARESPTPKGKGGRKPRP